MDNPGQELELIQVTLGPEVVPNYAKQQMVDNSLTNYTSQFVPAVLTESR